LIVCDERAGRGWDQKIYDRLEHYGKNEESGQGGQGGTRNIHVWGV
jgi:hypothetical protein